MGQVKSLRNSAASLYRRHASRVTEQEVLHPLEKEAELSGLPLRHRRQLAAELQARWAAAEEVARTEATSVLLTLGSSVEDLDGALTELAALRYPELLGKVEAEQLHVRKALSELKAATEAVARADFGAAGAAVEDAERELQHLGGQLVVVLNRALGQAAVGKEQRSRLENNLAERRQARLVLERSRDLGVVKLEAAHARLRQLEAAGYRQCAEILAVQARMAPAGRAGITKVGRGNELRVIPPQECETFADVGGLEDVKAQLQESVGAILERPDEAARYHVVHNGVLFYGPPGTGKNLLSRALAGEYGMRYLRFSPASIASGYLHEAAANLRQLFELARRSTPCVLYLDEIDTIASDRSDQPSADHREVVTQLMVCLEEYRRVPGLVIVAATNELDRLDPALREGRFDAKIYLPLPDPGGRQAVLQVHLSRRGAAVDWDGLDLAALAGLTNGYSAAALETVVSAAAQLALKASTLISQEILVQAIQARGGQHRLNLDVRVGWDEVVLAEETRQQLEEILTVFAQPELARSVGVRAPGGILLYGPPGTGKTTIAKAMASQVSASFYEMSAADLLSKWAGESEQRVAKLFSRARSNRPSIVFIDEVDALLARRRTESSSKWEERVLSQFLRELDGITGGDGVLLVGATNRADTMDEAIVGRRLVPIEVGLPDPAARLRLLELLCRDVKLARTVNLRTIAKETEGMSGADLKQLRDAAGMKALRRAAGSGGVTRAAVAVSGADFTAALETMRSKASLTMV